ncbi:hypothetical protein F0562_001566 [Nyssa sinensis]|uniref:Uncharacterized protein n=1 Tax=Nyssa sinensis TaxID=561372 RepID=A0A5J5C7I4_9ASTE|nr:hypothetical protein F0562_001566 [Nyssa sinensis]
MPPLAAAPPSSAQDTVPPPPSEADRAAQGMSQRQMAVDLIIGHARAAQAVAAILDNPEDTKRVNLLRAEQDAAYAELANSRTKQAVSFAELTAARAELAASQSEATSLKERCGIFYENQCTPRGGVNDVEIEDSNPVSPGPPPSQPVENIVVEDVVPLAAVPPVNID